MIKYGYTILYVEEVEATIDFYQRAFGFKKKFITPEKDYGELISGETTIAFASHELGGANFPEGFRKSDVNDKPFGIELTFVTDAIEADHTTTIKAGAISVTPIVEKPWGQ